MNQKESDKERVIELSIDDFEKMVARISSQKKRIEELENINAFLNDQIKDYNKKFSQKKETKPLSR